MKFHRFLVSAAFMASLCGAAPVQAAPISGVLQAAPSVRALETPANPQDVEKAYYRYHYHYHYHYYHRRHYYHTYYYHRRYYHPYYRHYYHRYYYHPYYRYHYWHPFYW